MLGMQPPREKKKFSILNAWSASVAKEWAEFVSKNVRHRPGFPSVFLEARCESIRRILESFQEDGVVKEKGDHANSS
jgi:hypothetical protein